MAQLICIALLTAEEYLLSSMKTAITRSPSNAVIVPLLDRITCGS